jgi:preprotein translocase subunit SecD
MRAILAGVVVAGALSAGPLRAAPVAGAYLVVDLEAWGQRAAEIERDRADLMRTLDQAGVAYADATISGPVITFRLADPRRFPDAKRALRSFTVNDIAADVRQLADGRTEVVVPSAWVVPGGGSELDAAVDAVIERAAARGVPEPEVVDLGARKVRLDFAGIADADLMRLLRTPEPRLTIQLVDSAASVPDAQAGRIPAGDDLAPSDLAGEPFLVVRRQVLLSGDEVADAQADVDPTDRPAVLIRFDQRGADLFAQVTRRHLGERFAVLLDGRVIFAPVISSVVSDGVGEISGDFTQAGAEGLARVIRSAAPLTPLVVEDGALPYHDDRAGPR